jgi:hypothetical protein
MVLSGIQEPENISSLDDSLPPYFTRLPSVTMFSSSKTKAFVFDQGEQVSVLVRASSSKAPIQIEEVREFATGDHVALTEAMGELNPKKTAGFLFAKCGVSPEQGFIRRATLDPKRLKEDNYLVEVASSQFRIEPDSNMIAVLNAHDGLSFDSAKVTTSKDVIFFGMPSSVAKSIQGSLLEKGIFPKSIELSSLVSLTALVDFLRFTASTKPTLVLELGRLSTQSYIVSAKGIDAIRPISVGLEGMVPVVQKELGLKDEESARKLFFTNTFDFTGMGAALCKKLLKELQSSMGFYEVQTGQSISQLVCTVLPTKLNWLESVIAAQLGISVLVPEIKPWLSSKNITLSPSVETSGLDARKFSALGLMIEFSAKVSDAGNS